MIGAAVLKKISILQPSFLKYQVYILAMKSCFAGK